MRWNREVEWSAEVVDFVLGLVGTDLCKDNYRTRMRLSQTRRIYEYKIDIRWRVRSYRSKRRRYLDRFGDCKTSRTHLTSN